MSINLRHHLTTTIAVALGVMIGSVGPGVAQAAYDAVNADKVDGKHAVGSGATVNARKGKLVATSPTTGRLPDNIIKKAPNSARLNGYPHQKLRFLALPASALEIEGPASYFSGGVSLPADSEAGVNIGFLVPPDHRVGDSLYMDVLFRDESLDACAMDLIVRGTMGPIGNSFTNGSWAIPPSNSDTGTLAFPADELTGHTRTFRWLLAAPPGNLVSFKLSRLGYTPADTCGAVNVSALQLRY